MSKKNQFCKNCGHEIDSETRKCPNCGKQYFKLKKSHLVISICVVIIMLLGYTTYYYYKSYKAYETSYQNLLNGTNEQTTEESTPENTVSENVSSYSTPTPAPTPEPRQYSVPERNNNENRCTVSGCNNRKQYSSDYCTRHGCFQVGCYNRTANNITQYCTEHKCHIPNCNSGAAYNSYYCYLHD